MKSGMNIIGLASACNKLETCSSPVFCLSRLALASSKDRRSFTKSASGRMSFGLSGDPTFGMINVGLVGESARSMLGRGADAGDPACESEWYDGSSTSDPGFGV